MLNSTDLIDLTGAGVSTESVIRDFRGEGGIWARYKPEIYGNIEGFLKDPSKFWKLAEDIAPTLFDAEPNPGHFALAELEKLKIIKAIITQNVDELHQKAGAVIVYEVHGNINRFTCLGCRASYTKDQVLNNILFKLSDVERFEKEFGVNSEGGLTKNITIPESLSSEDARELGRLRREKVTWDNSIKASVHIGIYCCNLDHPITRNELVDEVSKYSLPYTTIEKIWKAIPEELKKRAGRPPK